MDSRIHNVVYFILGELHILFLNIFYLDNIYRSVDHLALVSMWSMLLVIMNIH